MFTLKKLAGGAIALSLAASTSLYATNGDTLIGVGAKTRAMGGAGIAFSHGAESALVNPALISHVKETEISFGGTIFMPKIHTDIDYDFSMMGGAKTTLGADSKADISMIPAVAIASQVRENLYIGAGMWGTAGMGTDFRGKGGTYPVANMTGGTPAAPMYQQNGLFDMETTLQLMQFAVPVAYKMGNLSIGIAPILQYGSLDIHYTMPEVGGGGMPTGKQLNVGDGQNQDFGFGASIGAVYHFDAGFNIGAMYKSKVKMSYGKSISTAARRFGLTMGDDLDQPAEFGIGLGWHNGPHGIAIDWKRIQWGHAAGYKDFDWKDQDVFSIGYQYDAGTWALRLGYNHATNPLNLTSGNTQPEAALNMFNLLGFPATMENHLTAGGTYAFNDNFSADFTVVYGFKKTTSSELKGLSRMGITAVKNEHSELGLTVQLNYKF